MIALDTNVLVRFLVKDDPDQARRAEVWIARLTEDEPGFVGREVLLELVWVLSKAYQYSRGEITAALEGLLAAVELEVEDAGALGAILHLYGAEGHDFADVMIRQIGLARGASAMVTFDARAARLEGVELL